MAVDFAKMAEIRSGETNRVWCRVSAWHLL